MDLRVRPAKALTVLSADAGLYQWALKNWRQGAKALTVLSADAGGARLAAREAKHEGEGADGTER